MPEYIKENNLRVKSICVYINVYITIITIVKYIQLCVWVRVGNTQKEGYFLLFSTQIIDGAGKTVILLRNLLLADILDAEISHFTGKNAYWAQKDYLLWVLCQVDLLIRVLFYPEIYLKIIYGLLFRVIGVIFRVNQG